MNKEKVLALADYVEASGTFWMEEYFHDCGAAACLAGHGAELFSLRSQGLEDGVTSELDIGADRGGKLFRPYTNNFCFHAKPGSKGYITKEHAVAALRYLAKTGEVDYDRCTP